MLYAICDLLSAFTPRLRKDFRRFVPARLTLLPDSLAGRWTAYSFPSSPLVEWPGLSHRGIILVNFDSDLSGFGYLTGLGLSVNRSTHSQSDSADNPR